jgi:hypothetical protein
LNPENFYLYLKVQVYPGKYKKDIDLLDNKMIIAEK